MGAPGSRDARAARLREEERAGKEQRINASNAEATAQRLVERLHKRQEELARERQITALPPVLKGAALIIPKGLLVIQDVVVNHGGTLINSLQTHDKTFGLETMCVGGGQGMAMILERLS